MAGKKSSAKPSRKGKHNGKEGCLCGVQRAFVTDINDPLEQGRVKIRLQDSDEEGVWARVATLMAGHNRGTWFIPNLDDEVLVVFENGDPQLPFVVGALWSAVNAPPASMDPAGSNPLKLIRTRKGLQVMLNDADGEEKLVLETPGGQRIIMTDGPEAAVEIADSNGNSVKLEPSGLTINTPGVLRINAAAVEMSAAALTFNAGIAKFSGLVQADTVLSTTVISSLYVGGAGFVW